MNARILGRQIAATRMHFADEPATVGEHDAHDGARSEHGQLHLEPVPARRLVPKQDEPPSDRVDRHVEVSVVVVVGRREAATVDARDSLEPHAVSHGREPLVLSGLGDVLDDLDVLRIPPQIHDRYGAVGQHEIEVAVEIEVRPRRTPPRGPCAQGGGELRTCVGERRASRRPLAPIGAVQRAA